MARSMRGRGRGRGRVGACAPGDAGACVRCVGEACALADAHRGDRLTILDIPDADARMHAIRFGMQEGAPVSCVTRVPAGPIVLRSGRQEIAVGRGLARRITVRFDGVG